MLTVWPGGEDNIEVIKGWMYLYLDLLNRSLLFYFEIMLGSSIQMRPEVVLESAELVCQRVLFVLPLLSIVFSFANVFIAPILFMVLFFTLSFVLLQRYDILVPFILQEKTKLLRTKGF